MSDTFDIIQIPDAVNTYFYPNSDYSIDDDIFVGSNGDTQNFFKIDEIDDGGNYYGVWSNASYIFTACYGDGIRAYEIDSNNELSLIDTDTSSNKVYRLWGDDNYIYAACEGDGLYVYSFDGNSFTLEDNQDDGGDYYDVYCDDNYIYTACYNIGIRAYSFDGTNLSQVSHQNDGGYSMRLHGDGTYIYLGAGFSGLRAYSFDGNNFTLKDTEDVGCHHYGVFCQDSYIHVMTWGCGMAAYSFDGTNLSLEQNLDDGGMHYDVWGDGTYLYVANHTRGISKYSFDGTYTEINEPKTYSNDPYMIHGTNNYLYVAYNDDGLRLLDKSKYIAIDETIGNCNYDTDYISTTSTSIVSAYFSIPSHTTETGTINHVKLYSNNRATSIDSSSNSSFYLSLSDDTNYSNSSNRAPLRTGYLEYSTAFGTAPDGTSWSWSNIDSTYIGLKMKADTGNELRCSQLYLKVNYTPSSSTVSLLLPDRITRGHTRNVDRYLFPDGEYSVIDSGRSSKTLTLSGIQVTDSVTKIQNLENMLDYGNVVTLSSLPDSNMNTDYIVKSFNIDDISYNSETLNRVYRWTITLERTE